MIAPLAPSHVEAVARLHRQSLTGLLTDLGLPAIRAFYRGAARSPLCVGFVSVDPSVLGFVLGSPHSSPLRRDVWRRNPLGMALGLLPGLLASPSSARELWRGVRTPGAGGYDAEAAQLIYLAVSPDAGGRGIGRSLVESFGLELRRQGHSSYELSVDIDNGAAISFYEKLGFQPVGEYEEFGIRHRRFKSATPSDI